jgi:hypothetical protein
MENNMKQVVKFVMEKETKGTYRFAETGNLGIIGVLYVRKHAFGDAPVPETLTVTIEG